MKTVKCACCGIKVLESHPCRECGVRTISAASWKKLMKAISK